MNNPITRKAIIIGCPGKGNNYLFGVDYDLQNITTYLLSDRGGHWFENEITTLTNPTEQKIHTIVASAYADYVLIYFSGHGYTSTTHERMLVTNDKAISDLSLLNKSPRQLIIIDACRNYVRPGISGLPDFGDAYLDFEGQYPSRDMFDRRIAASPHGKMIIHATKKGKYSLDSSNGGYFTKALLHAATGIKLMANTVCSIEQILIYVPSILKSQGANQIPSISYSTGNLQVPFAVEIANQQEYKNHLPKPLTRLEQGQPNMAGAALLLLVLIIAANSN